MCSALFAVLGLWHAIATSGITVEENKASQHVKLMRSEQVPEGMHQETEVDSHEQGHTDHRLHEAHEAHEAHERHERHERHKRLNATLEVQSKQGTPVAALSANLKGDHAKPLIDRAPVETSYEVERAKAVEQNREDILLSQEFDWFGLGEFPRSYDCAQGDARRDGGCPMPGGAVWFRGTKPTVRTQGCAKSFSSRATYSSSLIVSLVMVGIGNVFNVYIVYMHLRYPSHPKFYFTWSAWFWNRTHLYSGIVEVTMGIAVWFVSSPIVLVRIMCCFALIHVFSCLFQVRILFGQKAVTEALYLYCALIKMYFIGSAFINPDCYNRVLGLILVTQIFAWFRFWYIVLKSVGLFPKSHYTMATVLSGSTIFPYMGVTYVFMMYLWIIIYRIRDFYVYDELIVISRSEERARAFQHEVFGKEIPPQPIEATNEEKASYVFNLVAGIDGKVEISLADITTLVVSCGMEKSDAEEIINRYGGAEAIIDEEAFKRDFEFLWAWIFRDLAGQSQWGASP